MTALPLLQHIVASGVVAAVGLWVCAISWTQEPAAAFLFPRIVSTVFAALALWTFAKALMGRTKVGNGLSREALVNLAPGLAIALIYVFWAARALGFYTATAIAVLLIVSIYDPAPHGAIRSWIRRLAVTAGFVAVMYGLFWGLLGVFTPREALF